MALSGGGYRTKFDVLAMATNVGACATLAKPFEREELLAAVSDALKTPLATERPDTVTGAAPGESPKQPQHRCPSKATVLLVDDDEQPQRRFYKLKCFNSSCSTNASTLWTDVRSISSHSACSA